MSGHIELEANHKLAKCNYPQKKKDLWHGDDVAQLEHSNNKYYALAFRYI